LAQRCNLELGRHDRGLKRNSNAAALVLKQRATFCSVTKNKQPTTFWAQTSPKKKQTYTIKNATTSSNGESSLACGIVSRQVRGFYCELFNSRSPDPEFKTKKTGGLLKALLRRTVHRITNLTTTTQNESKARLVNGRTTARRHAGGLAMC
jgi:hypothetical protein